MYIHHITHIPDSDEDAVLVQHGVVACEIGLPENIGKALKRFPCSQRFNELAVQIESGAHYTAAICMFDIGCDAIKCVIRSDKQSGGITEDTRCLVDQGE